MKQYRNIGKIVSAFGLKGEVVLQHHLGKKTSLKGLEVIFIEQVKEEMLPYFIQSSRIKSDDEVFIQLEGITIKEQTKQILQRQVWLSEEDFTKYASKTSAVSLVGFSIIDGDRNLGEILEVIEQPHQVICRIEIDKKEVLIPLHEETILRIDRKKKQVVVTLPEGLLDVYA